MTLPSATDSDPFGAPSRGTASPSLAATVAVALFVACLTAGGTTLALWGSASAALTGIDFNAALFEDFLGPYWQTARNLVAGDYTPAQGYLYPSALAWFLTPFVLLQQGLQGADTTSTVLPSCVAAAFVLGSLAVLLGSLFSLVRPRSIGTAAAAGAVLGLAHAPIHGAYWAQASLPAIAGLSAGVALMNRGRPVLAGAAIGLAAALKLHPIIGLLALMVPWQAGRHNVRAAGSALLFAFLSAVAIPATLMGRTAFVEFHRTTWGRLADINAWVMTETGGRGSQDVPVILGRVTSVEGPWVRRGIGWLIGALLLWMAFRLLRGQGSESRSTPDRPRALAAFVFLAAIPWAAVSPTWPHGLLWVPATWWLAWQSPSRVGWFFGAASLAAGSIVALRLTGSPASFAWYGLPAWSALLGLGAAAMAAFPRATG